jgi:hypothetical protein
MLHKFAVCEHCVVKCRTCRDAWPVQYCKVEHQGLLLCHSALLLTKLLSVTLITKPTLSSSDGCQTEFDETLLRHIPIQICKARCP